MNAQTLTTPPYFPINLYLYYHKSGAYPSSKKQVLQHQQFLLGSPQNASNRSFFIHINDRLTGRQLPDYSLLPLVNLHNVPEGSLIWGAVSQGRVNHQGALEIDRSIWRHPLPWSIAYSIVHSIHDMGNPGPKHGISCNALILATP